ncbi:hypothetical protein RXV03_28080, partial [Pseudomonas aeruginosa]|nr:hypothetical protein [Pseudomonas aeruginosa]
KIDPQIRDALVEELEQIRQIDIDKEGKIKIMPKEDIKERIGRSPDYSDAMMMRMYFTINQLAKKRPVQEKYEARYHPLTGQRMN